MQKHEKQLGRCDCPRVAAASPCSSRSGCNLAGGRRSARSAGEAAAVAEALSTSISSWCSFSDCLGVASPTGSPAASSALCLCKNAAASRHDICPSIPVPTGVTTPDISGIWRSEGLDRKKDMAPYTKLITCIHKDFVSVDKLPQEESSFALRHDDRTLGLFRKCLQQIDDTVMLRHAALQGIDFFLHRDLRAGSPYDTARSSARKVKGTCSPCTAGFRRKLNNT